MFSKPLLPEPEVFYFSKLRRFFSFGIGILICIVGAIKLVKQFPLDVQPMLLRPIIFLTSSSFIVIGFVFILLSFWKKKKAIFFSFFALALTLGEVILAFFIHPEGATATLFSWKHFFPSLSLFGLEVALLLIALFPLRQTYLWIAGILGGLNFGFALFIFMSDLIGMRDLLFRMDISFITAILTGLASIGILIESGSYFAFYFPNVLAASSATVVGLAALLLTISTWMAFQAREQELIAEISTERAETLEDSIEKRGNSFIFALIRMKERWSTPPEAQSERLQKLESLSYLKYFPWLREIGFVREGKKTKKILPHFNSETLPSFVEKMSLKNDDFNSPSIFFEQVNSNIYMIIYFAFNDDLNENRLLYTISDAREYFDYLIPNFLKKENGITISSQGIVLFQANEDETKYKKNYLATLFFAFHRAPLLIEVWPTPNYIQEITSPASSYQLFIGIILSLTIFCAFYFAYVASKKKKEAYEAINEKTMFLANMSHEIRTPLNGIIGSCSILEITPLKEDQKKWVKAIKKSGKVLLELIDDILDISKLETQGMKISYAEIDLKHLIEEAYVHLQQKAKKKNLELVFEYDSELSPIQIVDPRRVRQIVVNLVDNGIKYTREGFVRLEVFEENGFLVFRVEDSGVGIPESARSKIFKKYVRLDMRSEEGSGLGLAIVQKLTEMMNGSIEVQSRSSRGSIFTVRLPIIKNEIQNQE